MLAWNLYDGTAADWNASLSLAEDSNIFQSYEWGQYKDLPKLNTRRYIARNERGSICGMCQISIRELPFGLNFIWSAGGPVFQFQDSKLEKITDLISCLFAKLHEDYPQSLIRIHSYVSNTPNFAFKFNQVARRPLFKLNSGFTIRFEIQNIPDFRKNMSPKHRYYTKKSANTNIQWMNGNEDADLNHLVMLHQEMVASKDIASIGLNQQELIRMRDCLPNYLSVLTGFINGDPVTSCSTLEFHGNVFYMTAATGRKGRAESAAYAMVEKLFMQLKEKNAVSLDLAGVDPVSRQAAGVNHFKMGFGENLVEQLGEWESASSELVRIVINLAIRLKRGIA